MKFISVRQLSAALKLKFHSVNDELIERLRKAVHQHFTNSNELIAFNQSYSFQDLSFILDSLNEKKSRVFHGWIEQDTAFLHYLSSGGETLFNQEEIILKEQHQLFSAYQSFLFSYLNPILEEKIKAHLKDENLTDLVHHLKFCAFLSAKKRIEIQRPISDYLRQKVAQLKVSQGEKLTKEIRLVFSPSFVQVYNELDDHYYSDAIDFIDTGKRLVKNNPLSPLILDRIKSAFLSLKLNKKHQQQVVDFCNSDFFTHKSQFPPSRFQSMVKSPLFYVALIAIVINFIFFYPLNPTENAQPPQKETTGIDGLDAEELSKVDTMLGFQKDSVPLNAEELSNLSTPVFITADLESIKNVLAKKLYISMLEDYEIQRKQEVFFGCDDTEKKLYGQSLYAGVQSFASFESTDQKISNKSDEDVYVMMFEPFKEGEVYGELIASGRSANLELKKGNRIVFYSGKQINSFNPMRKENNGYGNVKDAKRIEKVFNYHFCGQNSYHFQQLNRIYKIEEERDIVFEKAGKGFNVVFIEK